MAVAAAQGFPHWLAVGTILHGWALTAQGRGEEGLAQMRQGLAAWQATGAAVHRTHFLALLAEAHGQTGAVDTGLTMLTEALAHVYATEERFYAAELYRLKGELVLQSGVQRQAPEVLTLDSGLRTLDAEAEACFIRALDIACGQQAKAWEWRAAVSLSRLWQQQGKRQEARLLPRGNLQVVYRRV